MSLRLTGGLLVSTVSLWTAALTGSTGLRTSLAGKLARTVLILGPPIKYKKPWLKNVLGISN